jgi:hypothetical protein
MDKTGERPDWGSKSLVGYRFRRNTGADVDLYACPVDGRRTRAISQSGIEHNAAYRINRRSA